MEILDQIKKDFVQELMKKGKRPEERGFFDYREIEIKKGVLGAAEGSALVKLGNTQVLAGIKFTVGTPFPDRQDEGILATNSELLPLASPTFEPGPPNENSIELARIVDRGIRSSEAIDLKKFYLTEGKVLALFIDLYVLDHSGNLIDASALAAMAALTDTKMPKTEEYKIIRGEYSGPLELKNKAVSCTFAKIGDGIVLDPSLDEEAALNARLTVATVPDRICAIQKAGIGSFKRQELESLFDTASEKGKELRKLV